MGTSMLVNLIIIKILDKIPEDGFCICRLSVFPGQKFASGSCFFLCQHPSTSPSIHTREFHCYSLHTQDVWTTDIEDWFTSLFF